MMQTVKRLCQRLSRQGREMFELLVIEQQSVEEVQQQTGLSRPAVYMWRCLQRVWFAAPTARAIVTREAPWSMRLPSLAMAAACLLFGIAAFVPVDIASAAARALLGGP